jgi:hypothetical protein
MLTTPVGPTAKLRLLVREPFKLFRFDKGRELGIATCRCNIFHLCIVHEQENFTLVDQVFETSRAGRVHVGWFYEC